MTDTKEYYNDQIYKIQTEIKWLDSKIEKPEYLSFFQLRVHRKRRAILRNQIKHYEKKILLLPQLDLFD